ncbi:hypothetical protein E2C01_102234 [Portunus trituberculatus]|uniref:Uncharacterized protein n=1 Tax=Portunus trituberculatus TaxID=210409 RepID=A0A5B7KGT1_PORTR|nr:hypothetical protein [Portunus trituberculatus]
MSATYTGSCSTTSPLSCRLLVDTGFHPLCPGPGLREERTGGILITGGPGRELGLSDGPRTQPGPVSQLPEILQLRAAASGVAPLAAVGTAG